MPVPDTQIQISGSSQELSTTEAQTPYDLCERDLRTHLAAVIEEIARGLKLSESLMGKEEHIAVAGVLSVLCDRKSVWSISRSSGGHQKDRCRWPDTWKLYMVSLDIVINNVFDCEMKSSEWERSLSLVRSVDLQY